MTITIALFVFLPSSMTSCGIFRPCPPALACLKHRSSSDGQVNSFPKMSIRRLVVGVEMVPVDSVTRGEVVI